MSPQRSNRATLIEGTLRCLERLPPERVTARAIAEESGANLASIAYHFGSKEELVTEAVVTGLDRWLEEIAAELERVVPEQDRLRQAWEAVEATGRRHTGLARNFLAALARAQHDERVRRRLATGFRDARVEVARVLELEDDDAGALALAQFNGLLFQSMLDPGLALDGDRVVRAQERLVNLGARKAPLPSGSGQDARER
jgi:AcrR family transcriptional regulator